MLTESSLAADGASRHESCYACRRREENGCCRTDWRHTVVTTQIFDELITCACASGLFRLVDCREGRPTTVVATQALCIGSCAYVPAAEPTDFLRS
jgi:hypothetical protein